MIENIKISMYIGVAFAISFVLLFSFFIMYDAGLLTITQINKIEIGDKNKIFLLGTSYVKAINSTHVQNILEKNGFDVLTLSPKVLKPTTTLEILDDVISTNPKLIVYGVGFGDIGLSDNTHSICTSSQIPPYIPNNSSSLNISDILNEQKIIGFSGFPQNPKYITLNIFENLLGKQITQFVFEHGLKKINIELYNFKQNEIISNTILNKTILPHYCMEFDIRDSELDNLDIIFAEFYKNDIEVIVFIPPYPEPYLNILSDSLKTDLKFNIKSISDKYNFQVHDLSSKFKNKNIFFDDTHVAHNPKSLIYSETIASLIMNCLNHMICK